MYQSIIVSIKVWNFQCPWIKYQTCGVIILSAANPIQDLKPHLNLTIFHMSYQPTFQWIYNLLLNQPTKLLNILKLPTVKPAYWSANLPTYGRIILPRPAVILPVARSNQRSKASQFQFKDQFRLRFQLQFQFQLLFQYQLSFSFRFSFSSVSSLRLSSVLDSVQFQYQFKDQFQFSVSTSVSVPASISVSSSDTVSVSLQRSVPVSFSTSVPAPVQFQSKVQFNFNLASDSDSISASSYLPNYPTQLPPY